MFNRPTFRALQGNDYFCIYTCSLGIYSESLNIFYYWFAFYTSLHINDMG